MGLEFIKRVQRSTAVVGVMAFLFISVYHDVYFGLGVLVGSAWGIANIWALAGVLTAALRPDVVARRRVYIFAAIKFPVLYALGYLALYSGLFPPVSLLAGFSLLFLVVLFKGLGRVFLHLDDPVSKRVNQGT